MSLLQEGLGSLRGAVGTPKQIEDLIDRYEAAGVDQVIFVSQAGRNRHEDICESMELFATTVLPKYAERADAADAARHERLGEAMDAALARREPRRRFDREYVISAQGEPDPAPPTVPAGTAGTRPSVAALRAGPPAEPRLPLSARITREIARGRARLQQQGQERFVSYLKGKPDDRLDRVLGSPPVLRAVFAGMARSFEPDKAQGFQGSIQYELTGSRGVQRWAIQVAGRDAYPVKGFAHDAAITLRMAMPTFAKIITGDVDGARAFFEGKVQIEGDLAVAARVS